MSITVLGRIVNKRPLSRKLVFLELERTGDHDLELLLKSADAADGLSEIEVRTLRDLLKLGDVVAASGYIESNGFTMRVTHIEITEPWKATHAGTSFVPKLLPSLHANKQSCQADNGSIPENFAPSHHDSAAAQPQQHRLIRQPLCKYWVNTGRCLRGDMCDYQHVKPSQLPELRQGWVTARRRHKQELSQEAGNPHGLDAARKGQRAAVFCDWLIATFGSPCGSALCVCLSCTSRTDLRLYMVSEVMKQGSGVLDIAGGRGNVSFELQTVRGIRCTLIDPRPQKISKSQRKWLKSFSASQQPCTAAAQHHKTDQFSATNDIPPTSPDLPSEACLHAPTGLQEPAAVAPASANAALSAVTSATQLPCSAAHHNMAQAQVPAAEGDVFLHNAQAQASTTEAEASSGENYAGKACTVQLTCQDEACLPQQSDSQAAAQHRPDLKGTLSQQIQAEFNAELWTEGKLGQQLQSCSLVLGLHPDQATDSIVDFAMQSGKPFAVVPCCVFPRQFQNRKLRNDHGTKQDVLTHPDLVQFLMQKSDGSQDYLAFQGMNRVVFRNIPILSTTESVGACQAPT